MLVLNKLTVLCTILLECVQSANILFIAHLSSPSHYLWNKALSFALIERGHNITILTHDSEKNFTPPNFTVITMEGFYDVLPEMFNYSEVMDRSVIVGIKLLYDYVKFRCEFDMESKGLEILLSYPKDMFDLILFDVTYGQCLYPIIDKFNRPPVVAVTAFLLPTHLSHAFGNHVFSSYMPFINSQYTNRMNFYERLLNFIYVNLDLLYRSYISTPAEYELAKKRFGDDIRTLEEIERNISILLANTDPLLNYPLALPPNIIPVGGLHIKPPQSLPENLRQVMDEAKHGVIYFSLGTNVRFEMLGVNQRHAIFNAFERVSQTVLWKIHSNNMTDFPKNVITEKWFPQNDILGHPNTKLFISHGGALSIQEAIYHGVPVVAIPFMFDQYINARKLVERKLAKYLDRTELTADNFYLTIKEVLDNPIYEKNVKAISRKYRDQPQTPIERGIFWIEYILRHGSAEHLVIPSRDMPFYELYSWNVLVVIVAVLFIACYFLLILANFLSNLLLLNYYKNLHLKKNN